MMRVSLAMRRAAACGAAVLVAAWLVPAAPAAQMGQGRAAAPSGPTPRTAGGKVDFTGVWVGDGNAAVPDAQGNVTVLTKGRPCHPGQLCAPAVNFERDSGFRQRMGPNLPLYKPEHWERVQELDVNGNREDPEWRCYPDGVPRMGPPSKVVQTANELILMYVRHNTFRVIPIDGREHDPIRSQDLTYMGDSVAKWEGDTLVVDSVGFTDESWLAWPGYFHSNKMRVVETFRRQGDQLIWQATVHDPDVLEEPWVMNPVRRNLNKDPKALLTEDLPCEERDVEHMNTRERG